LLQVEVLQALPGRPITGERLVRPDGTISLGFYGDVHVRGLTCAQIKCKLIEHLRFWLKDEVLGLIEPTSLAGPTAPSEESVEGQPQAGPRVPPTAPPAPPPPPPEAYEGSTAIDAPPPPSGSPSRKRSNVDPSGSKQRRERPSRFAPPSRSSSSRVGKLTAPYRSPSITAPIRRIADAQLPDGQTSAQPEQTGKFSLPANGQAMIKIEIKLEAPSQAVEKPMESPVTRADRIETQTSFPFSSSNNNAYRPAYIVIPPEQSTAVFVDVSAYNSASYYVQGEVAMTGRYPWTGKETALDAIHNSQSFISTSDTGNIRLVRPARGGKPAKVYRVDYKAIVEEGDARTNYQLFPGDRLIVGRKPIVQQTIEIDRLRAPFDSVIDSMRRYLLLIQSLDERTPGLSRAEREAIVKDWVEMWWKAASRPEGATLDKKTFQDTLLRHLDSVPAAAVPKVKEKK
jgi:protein involved in polysaccharide export with SLBB domain